MQENARLSFSPSEIKIWPYGFLHLSVRGYENPELPELKYRFKQTNKNPQRKVQKQEKKWIHFSSSPLSFLIDFTSISVHFKRGGWVSLTKVFKMLNNFVFTLHQLMFTLWRLVRKASDSRRQWGQAGRQLLLASCKLISAQLLAWIIPTPAVTWPALAIGLGIITFFV